MNSSISSLTSSLSGSTNYSGVKGTTSGQETTDQSNSSSSNESQQRPTRKQVEEVIKSLNEFVKPHQTSIQFKLYDKLNEYYVQVIDDSTKSVIQTIPSKQLLDAYSTMMQFVGVMFDKKG